MDNRLINEIKRSRKLMGLTEGLNLPKSTNNNMWFGSDKNLITSLDEYGYLIKQPVKRDYSDEYFVMYKVSDDAFDTGWIRESELDNIMLGKEWASEDDIKSILGYVDINLVQDWIKDTNFMVKFSDLTSYFGFENIMGSSYSTITLREAIDIINEDLPDDKKISPEDYV